MTSTRVAGREGDIDDRGANGDGNARLLALTDGVVAIAMTLLALDLKPDLPFGASSRDLAHYLGVFLLFFASDVPGRIATRRPEHQAEHGPRSALPAPRVAVEPASVEPASVEPAVAVVLAAILAAVVLAVPAVVVAPVVVPVSAEEAASIEKASQRFRGQNAAADTESEPAGSGEEALAA